MTNDRLTWIISSATKIKSGRGGESTVLSYLIKTVVLVN
jgi:hypothetical protein